MMVGINFNERQLNRLSEIYGNLGLLLLASMSVPVFSGNKEVSLNFFIAGIAIFLICLMASLSLIRC
jgi:hypothetical protein